MGDLSGGGRAGVAGAFGSTSRYLDGLLGVGSPCFGGMVGRICPSGLQLSGANTSGAGAPLLDLRLSVSNGFVSSRVCDKRGGFGFGVVGFPFLDGGVPRRPSCGVCVSQLIGFARVCIHVGDFNTRNKCLAAKLLKQGCRYHELRRPFSGFCCLHCGLVSKFSVGLGSLLRRGLSEPEFCGDLVCGFRGLGCGWFFWSV